MKSFFQIALCLVVIVAEINGAQAATVTPSFYNNGSLASYINTAGGITTGAPAILNNSGGAIGTFINQATITGSNRTDNTINNFVVGNLGSIHAFSSSGAINNYSHGNSMAVMNAGSIDSLTNSGVVHGSYALFNTRYNGSAGRIGILQNDGSITSNTIALTNMAGTIDRINNTHIISAVDYGVLNYYQGHIGALNNSGAITLNSVVDATAIANDVGSRIDTLNNSGSISITSQYAVTDTAIGNSGSVGSINNNKTGVVTSDGYGIYNNGAIDSVTNAGNIVGVLAGLYNGGTLGALANVGGILTGYQYALYNASGATLDAVTNTGTIAGTIRNDAVQDLTINGGTGTVFGTLTGAGTDGVSANNIGLITNAKSDLIFGSGNQLLNDNIDVGSFTVSNPGAALQANNTININGNYHQGSDASLILGVFSNATTTGIINTDSGYGRLMVSGSATIAAGSTVSLQQIGDYSFAQGQRYLVVQANSTDTNYNADRLHYTATGYNVAGAVVSGASVVDGSDTDLLVTLGAAPAVIPPVAPPVAPPDTGAATPVEDQIISLPEPTAPSFAPLNQASSPRGTAVLAGLFNYTAYKPAMLNLFNAVAALPSATAADHAAAQLSPTATTMAATQAATGSTEQVLNVVSAHVDGQRAAQSGNGASGTAIGESVSGAGLWGQAFGGTSRMEERDDIAGYNAHYSGLLLGADGPVNDSWRVGGLFSYADTGVNNEGANQGSSTDIKSYGLLGYASYLNNLGTPWYVDLSAGAIQHQYITARALGFAGFKGAATGEYNAIQYIAAAQAGYPIEFGSPSASTILTPMAGLTYSTLRQDSYTEHGSSAALHVDKISSDSIKSDLGAKLARTFTTSYGALEPSAKLTWRHEYLATGLQSVANYAADSTGATSFTSQGATPIKDTGVMAAGLTLVGGKDLELSLTYTLEAGGGYHANTGSVRVRWQY